MEAIFADFTRAHQEKDGPFLASCIIPTSPADFPTRFHDFVQSTNAQQILTDVRYATTYNGALSFTKAEAQAWQDVLTAFWKAGVEIVFPENGGKRADDRCSRVYDAWKELVNAVIRGYTSSAFPAWTVPCLYVAGKYLRVFAIKADEQAAKNKDDATFNGGFHEDMVESVSNHDKLEDAARQINRIFSLCISDRFVTA